MMVGEFSNIFFQLGLVVILVAIAAFLLRLIKQPQILAYILVGILITPVFHFITDTSIIESMSIFGVAFFLFLVGLEMDLKSLKTVALVSIFGGTIQIVILFVTGYLTALMLGFLSLEAAYLGLMFSFSSTMIVMKLLSDKRELSTLHGRIALGILILEDIFAILSLSILTNIGGFTGFSFLIALLKFASLFVVAFLASRYFFPVVFNFAAKKQELLLICSLAVCFLFSLAFYYIGFSIAIGAFIAGITLGNLKYNYEIIGRIRSLRDFFSLLFFVSLGMGLSISVIQKMWFPFLVILLLILFFKPLLTLLICSIFRYTPKPSFLTAISLAQIGEFSLIIAAQGLALGHISSEFFSLIVMAALFTITVTSYSVQYESQLYSLAQKPLKILEVFAVKGSGTLPMEVKPKIILCGHNRIGYSILKSLAPIKKKVLVVDYNPEVITHVSKEGFYSLYGDVTDDEIMERMNLKQIQLLISTVPDLHDTQLLIKKVREENRKAQIIVTASENEDALKFYELGADYVIMPHFLGGEHVANMIELLNQNKLKLQEEKAKHIAHIHERKHLNHEHPKGR